MTRRLLLLTLLACVGSFGCDDVPASGEVEQPKGPSDPLTLKYDFQALVKGLQAKKDDAAVVVFLEPYLLTRQQLGALFGPELGERAWTGYSDSVAAKLRTEAGEVILREVVQNGRTEVFVGRVGPAWPARTTRGDLAMLDAMKSVQPMYTVWLRKPGEELGVRLNGFVFFEGRWRALLKVYDHFAAPETDAPTPAAPPSTAPESSAPPE